MPNILVKLYDAGADFLDHHPRIQRVHRQIQKAIIHALHKKAEDQNQNGTNPVLVLSDILSPNKLKSTTAACWILAFLAILDFCITLRLKSLIIAIVSYLFAHIFTPNPIPPRASPTRKPVVQPARDNETNTSKIPFMFFLIIGWLAWITVCLTIPDETHRFLMDISFPTDTFGGDILNDMRQALLTYGQSTGIFILIGCFFIFWWIIILIILYRGIAWCLRRLWCLIRTPPRDI